MASADLDYIRALLIAQTAGPEPEGRGLFGRFLAPRRERRPAPPSPPPATARFIIADPVDTGQELLLEQICGPTLEVETASPLPPPSPRSEFGRRADGAVEAELTLDQPAGQSHRLQVLDPAGQAIGEMILHPQAHTAQLVATSRDEAHAVPYFPEDFLEPQFPGEPQPMRPWIKALRNSGAQRAEPGPMTFEPALPAPGSSDAGPAAPPIRKRSTRKKSKQDTAAASDAMPLPPTPHPSAPGFGYDLLQALALALTREHENLSDRLAAAAREALFKPEAASNLA